MWIRWSKTCFLRKQSARLSATTCSAKNLSFAGETAFHKLYLDYPRRYSEDLDFVRMSSGGIGNVMKRLTEMGQSLGYEVKTQMARHPKVFWRFSSVSGIRRKIKWR